MPFDQEKFFALLKTAAKRRVSDIHIRANERPCLRENGPLIPVKMEAYNESDIKEICRIIIKDPQIKDNLDDLKDYDGGYEVTGVCRLRYNILRYQDHLGIIFRVIPFNVPKLSDLGLSPIISEIALSERGLILLTGATGEGKSSTLAAMIDYINEKKSVHIITIEDPVEFLHQNKKSKITQREIGLDTPDFTTALRSALRQDPDVLLIGEMRDAQTVDTALKAAETGHVVFATIHTTDALTTMGRILSMFDGEEQNNVKERLAINLTATISQRLLPNIKGDGKTVAQEIMVSNPGVRSCIAGEYPLEGIYQYIEKGGQGGSGSQSFDQHLHQLYQKGKISLETAKAAAKSEKDFIRSLTFENIK